MCAYKRNHSDLTPPKKSFPIHSHSTINDTHLGHLYFAKSLVHTRLVNFERIRFDKYGFIMDLHKLSYKIFRILTPFQVRESWVLEEIPGNDLPLAQLWQSLRINSRPGLGKIYLEL